MGWQAGRTASLFSTRNSVDYTSVLWLKIMRARYGPVRMGLPMENSAKFGMAASGATRRWAVLATASSACMRTARGISGPDWRWECGDGDPDRRNSIRYQACQTEERRA